MDSESYQKKILLYCPKANLLIILLYVLLYESKMSLDIFFQKYPTLCTYIHDHLSCLSEGAFSDIPRSYVVF